MSIKFKPSDYMESRELKSIRIGKSLITSNEEADDNDDGVYIWLHGI